VSAQADPAALTPPWSDTGPEALRRVFRRHAAAVAVVTAEYQGAPVGLLVTSLASVSVDPPLISFNVARSSSTWPALSVVEFIGVHVLDAGQQDLAHRFARKGADRFSAPTSWQSGPHGAPVINGVAARAVARIEQRVEAGDHVIFVARLLCADARDGADPLLHHDGEYHRVRPLSASGAGSRLTVIRNALPEARVADPVTASPIRDDDQSRDVNQRGPGPQYASAADTERFGRYRIPDDPADPRPHYRFAGRLHAPGSSRPDTRFVAEPGRFHLYSGWFCPWAQRSTLVIALAGLADVVSVSYVDGVRDARGWAFREPNGPDPVNRFTLLREAYEATEPGFDGHVSVPTLWDRQIHRVASNDYATLDADLATEFQDWSTTGVELYPADLRGEIDELERWLRPAVNQGVGIAAGDGDEAAAARAGVQAAFDQLERTFAESRYLLGDRLTLADVRLFVTLVRYDRQANASGRVGPPLSELPNLWDYARELFQQKAFRDTTRFDSFRPRSGEAAVDRRTEPGAVPDWAEPVVRAFERDERRP